MNAIPALKGRMDTTMFPWNTPADLQGMLVLYMGTFRFWSMWRIRRPALMRASSNENEQPITNVTISLDQISSPILVTSSENTPSRNTRYRGTSLRMSISPSWNTPGSKTCSKGQGFGFLWQKSKKSNAYSFGKMQRLACAYPGARPEVCPLNSPDRHFNRTSWGDNMLWWMRCT